MLDTNNEIAVIDFQDATWGPAYDLVSLTQDVRLPFDSEQALTDQFILKRPHKKQLSNKHYPFFALQRATKIFGVFTRLALKDAYYKQLHFLPNTLTIMEHALSYKVCEPMRAWFQKLDLRKRLKLLGHAAS